MGEIAEALRRARESGPKAVPLEGAPRPVQRGPHRGSGPRRDGPREGAASLAELSHVEEGSWRARALVVREDGPLPASIRQLALRVRRELPREARSLAVLSAIAGEGKTTVACNLALALANLEGGGGVALVELDLHRPTMAASLGVSVSTGIDDVVLGGADLQQACIPFRDPPIDLYPVRTSRRHTSDLFAGADLDALFRDLERRYGLIVVDTPPTMLVADTQFIIQHADSCVVVARRRKSPAKALLRMVEQLPREKLLGAIWNDGGLPVRAAYYYHYRDTAQPQQP